MIPRESLDPPNIYFAQQKKPIEFVPSGCTMLDLALGGGWAERRISNVVGDRSTGKTLIAIEAVTNFVRKYADGNAIYRETESAFDSDYAAALGLPLDRVDFGQGLHNPEESAKLETVEDLFEDLDKTIKQAAEPTFYVVDSLDALSDRAELKRPVEKGTYGMAKPKLLSEMFRRLTARMSEKNVTLLIISQVRSNITTMPFAKSWVRSGGKALDFYSSQVLYLAQTGLIKRQVGKIIRPTGISIDAKLDKNKVSLPFRSAQFEITFGYGIDDFKASVTWLDKNIGPSAFPHKLKPAAVLKAMREGDEELIDAMRQIVTDQWFEVERSFLPTKGKYT